MSISDELNEAMRPHFYTVNQSGSPVFPWISDTLIVMWIIMAVIVLLAVIFTRNLKQIPQGKQNVAEVIVEFINNLVKENMGHHWKAFAPYLGTVLLFLIFSNIISIFNIIPKGEQLYELTGIEIFKHLPSFSLRPPTRNINVTTCMAVMTILIVLYSGIRYKKLSGWLRSFIEPVPIMLPMKIMEYGIRTLSLALRLFGNILGAFIVMELLYMAISPVFPAIMSIYFDLFDGILQAYVFVFLSTLYIGEAIE